MPQGGKSYSKPPGGVPGGGTKGSSKAKVRSEKRPPFLPRGRAVPNGPNPPGTSKAKARSEK